LVEKNFERAFFWTWSLKTCQCLGSTLSYRKCLYLMCSWGCDCGPPEVHSGQPECMILSSLAHSSSLLLSLSSSTGKVVPEVREKAPIISLTPTVNATN
jgi:hypothetical protein